MLSSHSNAADMPLQFCRIHVTVLVILLPNRGHFTLHQQWPLWYTWEDNPRVLHISRNRTYRSIFTSYTKFPRIFICFNSFFTLFSILRCPLALVPVPSPRGDFGGLSSQKSSNPPNWNNKQCKSVELLSNLNVKPPCTNVKPPYWRLSGDGSAWCPFSMCSMCLIVNAPLLAAIHQRRVLGGKAASGSLEWYDLHRAVSTNLTGVCSKPAELIQLASL